MMKNLSILAFSTLLTVHALSSSVIHSPVFDTAADTLVTANISLVGDLMCHTPQMEYSRIGKDSFDFKPVFSEVKKILSASDLTIGNLETTISGKAERLSGYPLFNTPDGYLAALKDAGFDLLLTANNHAIDRGKSGVLRTIEMINRNGMKSIGTYKSERDRDSVRIFEINGIRLAFIAYTFGVNGNYLPPKEKYLVNVIDTNLIRTDISRSRKDKADLVIVYYHFGSENQRQPNSYQRKLAEFTIECGADIIFGSHPHVVQPIEFFSSSKNRIGEGVVVYSLGNFLSNQRWRYSDAGMILNLRIEKNISNGNIRLSEISFIPTWVFKGIRENRKEFLILPADTAATDNRNYLTPADRSKMIQAYQDVSKMFSNITSRYLNENKK